MRRILLALFVIVSALAAYLLLWPVPVEPVASTVSATATPPTRESSGMLRSPGGSTPRRRASTRLARTTALL